MKNTIAFAAVILLLFPLASIAQLDHIDPGKYDDSWWNRAPYRLVQTNLREIDATMDKEAYVKSIEDVSANVVLLNVGGIVANYPTVLPFHYRNPNMKGDLAGDLIGKLHAKGIKVIGRFDFSKLNETLASKKPEWLYVGTDGKNVNYNGQVHTCINGGYQQEYAFEILKEAISRYPLDGIFFNMVGYTTSDYSGVYHGICQCANCQERFRDSTGYSLPLKADMNDPVYRAYNSFRQSTSGELFNEIRDHIKALNPKIMINTYSDAGVDMIASESSASLSPRLEWNYSATANVKPVLGSYKDRSPGNLLIYFQAIQYRHIGTSPSLARVWMLENMLHAAPLGFVVIGTLVNYEDRIFIPTLQELYGFHRRNEKLFTNMQSAATVALVRGSGEEYAGLIKLLTEEHVIFDVIEPSALGSARNPRSLGDYDLLIVGDVQEMSESSVTLIDDYVRNGGKLLVTGASATEDETGQPLNRIALKSLGVAPQYEKLVQAPSTYLKISNDDKSILGVKYFEEFSLMMMYSDFLKCRPEGSAQGLMRLIPETMFGPPEKSYFKDDEITDVPGLFTHGYGQGKAVFVPWMLGSQYYLKGNYMHRRLFLATLHNLLKAESKLTTDAPHLLEMTHLVNINNAFEWVGMINHAGQVGGSIRDPVPLRDITVEIKPQKPVSEVRLMRSGISVPFTENSGWIRYVIPDVTDFEMAVLFYQ